LGNSEASAQLDASGSRSEGSPIVSYRWEEDYKPLAEGIRAGVNLGVGHHDIHLVVRDGRGREARKVAWIDVEPDVRGLRNYAPSARISSSRLHAGKPENLVDGTRVNQGLADMWMTEADLSSQLLMEFSESVKPTAIILSFNRNDPSLERVKQQSSGFRLILADTPDDPGHIILDRHPGELLPPSRLLVVEVPSGITGRYLKLVKTTPTHLGLAELEIWGKP
jgi:hypothetical protein